MSRRGRSTESTIHIKLDKDTCQNDSKVGNLNSNPIANERLQNSMKKIEKQMKNCCIKKCRTKKYPVA